MWAKSTNNTRPSTQTDGFGRALYQKVNQNGHMNAQHNDNSAKLLYPSQPWTQERFAPSLHPVFAGSSIGFGGCIRVGLLCFLSPFRCITWSGCQCCEKCSRHLCRNDSGVQGKRLRFRLAFSGCCNDGHGGPRRCHVQGVSRVLVAAAFAVSIIFIYPECGSAVSSCSCVLAWLVCLASAFVVCVLYFFPHRLCGDQI